MWRAWLIAVVACGGAGAKPSTPPSSSTTSSPTTIASPTSSTSSRHELIAIDLATALPKPEPVEPLPFAPDPVDDGTTKGAVAVPDDATVASLDGELGLDVIDKTVTFAELPALGAAWKQRARVTYKGIVPVAINHSWDHVNLTFVGTEINASGYPGALKSFPLVSSDDTGPWSSSFPAFDKKGPILAAIRVLPSTHGRSDVKPPENERRQVVVYQPKGAKVVLVATKLVTDTAWTPLLRVDTPKATRIDVIDPGWH